VKAAAVPLALVPALGAVQGGFQPDAWVWSGALAAWAAALVLVATAHPGLLRSSWAWPAAAGLLLGWTALSALWSARPAQSILEARRAVLYAAVVLALVLLARAGSARLLVIATHAATTGLLVYALARYLAVRRYDQFEGYLLSQPLGYANAVGVLAALAIVLALGVAAAERGWTGTAAAATVPLLATALTLTSSDASWLALGVGIAAAALFAPEPERLVAVLAGVAMPTVGLVALARFSRYAAVTGSPRLGGAALAGVVVAGVAVTVPLARLTRPLRLPVTRRAILAVVVALAAAGALAVAHAGSTEPRASYWRVAWHDFTAHPAGGSGAGTFGFEWIRRGDPSSYGGALDAHSLYIETLAELGIVGLALLLAFLLPPLVALRRGSAYSAAAAGAYCVFVVHAGLDWDWEMPAVVVAALACGAAVLASRPARETALSTSRRAALGAAALVLAGCAIAGARSHTAPGTTRAPQRGALVPPVVSSPRRYLP
jgi:O-antigen ligase